ncbi:MAG TPA: hypothetical protein ENK75_07270, partial [Saprospiraceae bacterium]|nr:hypothetical protein [Saprospiraceae bacterium]
MTTITIKNGIALPKDEFESLEELRDFLNVLLIDFKEISNTANTKTTLNKIAKTKNIPLSNFI